MQLNGVHQPFGYGHSSLTKQLKRREFSVSTIREPEQNLTFSFRGTLSHGQYTWKDFVPLLVKWKAY